MSNLIEKKSSNSISLNGDVAIDMDSPIQNEIEPLRRVTSPRYSHEKSSIKCKLTSWKSSNVLITINLMLTRLIDMS